MISRISLFGIAIAALFLNALLSARADGVPVRMSSDTGVPEPIFNHGMVLNHDLGTGWRPMPERRIHEPLS
jgi:hypothetical protein